MIIFILTKLTRYTWQNNNILIYGWFGPKLTDNLETYEPSPQGGINYWLGYRQFSHSLHEWKSHFAYFHPCCISKYKFYLFLNYLIYHITL